jgi:hypothetical protein
VVSLLAEAAEVEETTSGVMCSGVATMTEALGTKGVQRITADRSAESGMSTWGGRGSKSARLKELTEMAGVVAVDNMVNWAKVNCVTMNSFSRP